MIPLTASHHLGIFTNGSDLNGYRQGAVLALHHQPLYAGENLPYVWFAYPPFAAILFYPFAFLAFDIIHIIWFFISFVAVIATVWRCFTTLRYQPTLQLALFSFGVGIAALDIEAIRGTLWQGQINIVLMAIIVWDLTRAKGARLRGWSVGIAAGAKLTAIVFVPYLVVTRQWRSATTAMIIAGISVIMGCLILPDDSKEYWFHAVFQIDHIGSLTHPGNRSIGGFLSTLWSPSPMPTGLWFSCALVAFILGLFAAWSASRAGNSVLAITIVGLSGCVVPPLAWGHHWVWFAPLLVLMLDKTMRSYGAERWRSVVVTCGLMGAIFMWFSTWTYHEVIRINVASPMYEEATASAFEHMPRAAKLVTTGEPPVIYLIVVITTVITIRKSMRNVWRGIDFSELAHVPVPDRRR